MSEGTEAASVGVATARSNVQCEVRHCPSQGRQGQSLTQPGLGLRGERTPSRPGEVAMLCGREGEPYHMAKGVALELDIATDR